jgi:hypothetical protein
LNPFYSFRFRAHRKVYKWKARNQFMPISDESEQVIVTVPIAWKIEAHSKKRNFAKVQDMIRELIRRDIEAEA